MKVKVCGMKEAANIVAINALEPDYMGFIFHPKSPRFVIELPAVPAARNTKKVGVFVNADEALIAQKKVTFELDYLQLHGNESPEFCARLKEQGHHLIKVFSVSDRFEFSITEHYAPFCDFFLFDTKGKNPGGNGHVFDWRLLKKYQSNTPFFLSGGITLRHLETVKAIANDFNIHGLDVNSGFEVSPGIKDVDKIAQLIEVL